MKSLWLVIMTIIATLSSGEAFARRADREGLNFGATFGMSDRDQKRLGQEEGRADSRMVSSSQSVSPYVGYVVGEFLNLGLSLNFQSEQSEETIRGLEAGEDLLRSRHSSLQGTSLFARFLFGRYFYFEAGGGIYSRATQTTTEYINNVSDAEFTGKREELQTKDIGPGYHAGGGIEVPIADGFFFTTNYLVRIYQLRSVKSQTELGNKTGREKIRELTFGVSHYYE